MVRLFNSPLEDLHFVFIPVYSPLCVFKWLRTRYSDLFLDGNPSISAVLRGSVRTYLPPRPILSPTRPLTIKQRKRWGGCPLPHIIFFWSHSPFVATHLTTEIVGSLFHPSSIFAILLPLSCFICILLVSKCFSYFLVIPLVYSLPQFCLYYSPNILLLRPIQNLNTGRYHDTWEATRRK